MEIYISNFFLSKKMCECKNKPTTITSGCSCSSPATIINPKTIVLISSDDPSSGKYSIETSILKTKTGIGIQKRIYTGQGFGNDQNAIVQSIYLKFIEAMVDIIRSAIGEGYPSPPTFNSITHLSSVDGFKIYFNNVMASGSSTPYLTAGTMDRAKVDYVSETMYPLFRAIERHILGAESAGPPEVCPPSTGSSRIFNFSVINCLFTFDFIYN